MPKKVSGSHNRYWRKRIRSKAFRRALTGAVKRELHAIASERVRDVLDIDLVRRLVREWDARIINQAIVADLVVQANRRFVKQLRQRHGSILDLLDDQLIADVDAILDEGIDLSPSVEDFVEKLMRQEFMRRLFTDIIFTSLVSFYQRINPLFAALTTQVLEDQIKGFIRLFLPAIQRQATAFALSKQNQRILLDFTRSIIRQLLEEPLAHYAAVSPPGRQKKMEALMRNMVANAKLDALARKVTLATLDNAYNAIGARRVGDLLRFDEYGDWLAERIVDGILPALARPHVLEFIAREMALLRQSEPIAAGV